jgi:hypothetical protein
MRHGAAARMKKAICERCHKRRASVRTNVEVYGKPKRCDECQAKPKGE